MVMDQKSTTEKSERQLFIADMQSPCVLQKPCAQRTQTAQRKGATR